MEDRSIGEAAAIVTSGKLAGLVCRALGSWEMRPAA
jgi:hypothetical protein